MQQRQTPQLIHRSLEEQFNMIVETHHKISVTHFNGKSLCANFQNIKEHVSQFKNLFTIIAIS